MEEKKIMKTEAQMEMTKLMRKIIAKLDLGYWKEIDFKRNTVHYYITLKQPYQGGYMINFGIFTSGTLTYQIWGNEIVRDCKGFKMSDKVKYINYEDYSEMTKEEFKQVLKTRIKEDILNLIHDFEVEYSHMEYPKLTNEYENNNIFTFNNQIY